MNRVIPYEEVLQVSADKGLKALYHNAGALGFLRETALHHVGWIGPPDPSIRPEAVRFTKAIPPPYSENLTNLAAQAWKSVLPGPVWVMPRSHWAYELDFGSKAWLLSILDDLGVDRSLLSKGEAIEFLPAESDKFGSFLRALLDNLSGSSDFQLVWPDLPVLCMVHHHQQLWWSTTDETLAQHLLSVGV